MKAKIILADDHKIVREGLRNVIESSPAYTVIAEADNGRQAVKLAAEKNPDIILMDVAMPDLNGIEAAKQILNINPGIRIIGLSMHSDKQFVSGMLAAGAYAYLLKDCDSGELMKAIDTVMHNQKYVSNKISGLILTDFISGLDDDDCALSLREREILQLIAEGKSSKQIGELLFVSSKTVDVHRKNIMDKLKLHTLPELTKYAIRSGLTGIDT
ncbi:MAG: response regulator transcription factor [Bacteroidales bacterium]|nr:response regulator transcription factor [Bacteroidales bacterium]